MGDSLRPVRDNQTVLHFRLQLPGTSARTPACRRSPN
jgi:hypothetical protein